MLKALWSYEISSSALTLANQNRLGRNFTAKRTVMWHTLLQTSGAVCQTLSPKQCIISPTSRRTISLKCFWEGVIFPEKPHFGKCLGYTYSTRTPCLTFRPTANLSIAHYSRRTRDVCTRMSFFIRLTIFEI